MSTTKLPAPAEPAQRGCSITTCDGTRYARGLCHKHYAKHMRLITHRGDSDQIPADTARAHIHQLRRRGWSWDLIGVPSHTSHGFLKRIANGDLQTIRRDKAAQILAVEPVWQETHLAVPHTGTQRRVSALAWQGWPATEIARHIGLSKWPLHNMAREGTVEARTAAKVARFYDEHAHQPGPNASFAKKARTQGAIPAAAWEGDIDDPDTSPEGVASPKPASRTSAVLVEDYDYLVSAGLSPELTAKQLGIEPESIGNARRRVKVSQARKAQAARKQEEAA